MSKFCVTVFLTTMSTLCVCQKLQAKDACPPIFRAAEVAMHDFSERLKEHRVETDFQAYASDLSHYEIFLSEREGRVMVRFKLKREGAVFAGGAADYVVSKADMKIVSYQIEK